MAKEIELKFLIREDETLYYTSEFLSFYKSAEELDKKVINYGKFIQQGYFPVEDGMFLAEFLKLNVYFTPIESRLRNKAGKFYFTLKGDGVLERDEIESEIKQDIFDKLWPLTEGKRVEKYRLVQKHDRFTIEWDVYNDRDLIVAEIEMPSIDIAQRIKPIGKDITNDKNYKNKNLAK